MRAGKDRRIFFPAELFRGRSLGRRAQPCAPQTFPLEQDFSSVSGNRRPGRFHSGVFTTTLQFLTKRSNSSATSDPPSGTGPHKIT